MPFDENLLEQAEEICDHLKSLAEETAPSDPLLSGTFLALEIRATSLAGRIAERVLESEQAEPGLLRAAQAELTELKSNFECDWDAAIIDAQDCGALGFRLNMLRLSLEQAHNHAQRALRPRLNPEELHQETAQLTDELRAVIRKTSHHTFFRPSELGRLERATTRTLQAAQRYRQQPDFDTELRFEDALLNLCAQLSLRCARRGTPPDELRVLRRSQALWAALEDALPLAAPPVNEYQPLLDSSLETPGS